MLFSRRREKEKLTHDFNRSRGWGHDVVWRPEEGGLRGQATGWCEDIREGDYIILPTADKQGSRYEVEKIRYYADPDDMFTATLVFNPRMHMEEVG